MSPRTLQKIPRGEAAQPAEVVRTETKTGARVRRGRYVSESILGRRRRMLEVAKAMIAEGGSAGFTIRELGRRAKVSVTTIYATYGDKEGLIAAAIQDYYDGLPLARARQTTSLPALLATTNLAREAILANKPYARQYAALYFSGTLDPRIYKVIQETATASAGQMPWLQKIMRDGDLLPGLDPDSIVTLLANQRLMCCTTGRRGASGTRIWRRRPRGPS
jgi:AcrR family transcriptional regulator